MNKLTLAATTLLIACGGSSATKSTSPTPNNIAKASSTAKGSSTAAPKAGASLYDRLGGKAAIIAVTDEFITRVATDARIKHRFFNTDIPRLKTLLVELVCMATGGPCTYSGLDMETAHAGMELVEEELVALVEDLAGALDKFSVPEREKGELLGALGPMGPMMITPKERL